MPVITDITLVGFVLALVYNARMLYHLIHYNCMSIHFIRSSTRGGCWINMGSVGGRVWSSPNVILILLAHTCEVEGG